MKRTEVGQERQDKKGEREKRWERWKGGDLNQKYTNKCINSVRLLQGCHTCTHNEEKVWGADVCYYIFFE